MTGNLPDLLRASVSGLFYTLQGKVPSKRRLHRFCPSPASLWVTATQGRNHYCRLNSTSVTRLTSQCSVTVMSTTFDRRWQLTAVGRPSL